MTTTVFLGGVHHQFSDYDFCACIKKPNVNRNVSTAMYHSIITGGISEIGFDTYFCFQNGTLLQVQVLPAVVGTRQHYDGAYVMATQSFFEAFKK